MSRRVALPIVLLCAGSVLGQQHLDSSGNAYLKGKYYFRWVTYSGINQQGVVAEATAAYGAISFDGNGAYQIAGQMVDSKISPGQATAFTPTGTYTVSSSGMAEIQNPVRPGDTVYAGVGVAGVVGSSTERNNYDLLVAIPAPAPAAGNGSLSGKYWLDWFDFPLQGTSGTTQGDLILSTADGNGNLTNLQSVTCLDGSICSSVHNTATYSIAPDGSGTATFPGGSGVNLSGTEALYVSADGKMMVGGSANGYDIVVGVQALSGDAANSAYAGLYFSAAIQHRVDNSGNESLRGARNITAGNAYLYERFNIAPASPASHWEGVHVSPVHSLASGMMYAKDGSVYRVVGADGRVVLEFPASRSLDAQGLAETDEGALVAMQALPQGGQPGVFLSPYGVVNAADLAPVANPIAPGEFISLFGSGFASAPASAGALPLPTNLGGVQVLINGRLAPSTFAGPNQINAVVPYATAEPYASVQVIANGQASNTVTVYTRASNPGFFTNPPGGAGAPLLLHADYSLVTTGHPVQSGETLILFLTGLGAVTPAVMDGSPAPSNPPAIAPAALNLQAWIENSSGGPALPIVFAGLAPGFAGLYQMNLTVPSLRSLIPFGDTSPPYPFTLEVDTQDVSIVATVPVNPF